MIKLTNVTKRYNKVVALDNINLELPSTGFIIIKGENGSGKSTLLNMIGLLDKPILGSIKIDDREMTTLEEDDLSSYREKYMSYVFQDTNLFDGMTVEENIGLFAESEEYEKLLNLLAIKDLKNKSVKELSGGERSRVGIARALMKNAKVFLIDEPTAAIDADSKEMIYDAFAKLSEHHLVIMITHDIEKAVSRGDIIITMNKGHIENIERMHIEGRENVGKPQKKYYDVWNFTKKNLFVNKKKMARSSVLLLLSFFLIMISSSLSTLDFIKMQADTMNLESDTNLTISSRSFEKNEDLFSEKTLATMESDFGQKIYVGKKIVVEDEAIGFTLTYPESWKEESAYYSHRIHEFLFYDSLNLTLKLGRMPQETNEVVITSYLADQIVQFGIKDATGATYQPKDTEKLLNDRRKLSLSGVSVVVSGISHLDMQVFEPLKEEMDSYLYYRMQSYIERMAGRILVNEQFFEKFEYYNRTIKSNYKIVTGPGHYLLGSREDLDFYVFDEPVALKRTDDMIYELKRDEIIANGRVLDALPPDVKDPIGQTVKLYFEDVTSDKDPETFEFKIVGISANSKNYMSKEALDPYLDDPVKTERLDIFASEKPSIEKILRKYSWLAEDDEYIAESNYSYKYDSLYEFCILSKIGSGIFGILFAIMTIFFNTNYIFDSIDEHKKQISTLKAFGIKNKKIFQTFLLEIASITTKAYIFSLVAFLLVRPIVNRVASYIVAFKVNIMPVPVLYLFGILLLFLVIDYCLTLLSFKTIKNISPTETYKKDAF